MQKSYLLLLFCLFAFGLKAQTVRTMTASGIGIDDALLLDSAGNVYGSGYDSGVIYKMDPAGNVSTYIGGFSAANGLEWDGLGNLVMCDNTGDKIYKIASDTTASVFLNINSPSGIIKDPLSDTLYFTTYVGHAIYKVAPDTQLVQWAGGPPLDGPVGLAWDDSLNLLIGNFDNNRVYRINRQGVMDTIGNFLTSGRLGFIIYHRGYIYGTLFTSNRIYRMDLNGNVEFVAGTNFGAVDGPGATAKFSQPNGIIASKGGDSLLISDYGSKTIRVLTGLDSIGLVGVNEYPWQGLWSVYPQPAQHRIKLRGSLRQPGELRLKIFGMDGNPVRETVQLSGFYGENEWELEVGDLPPGLYIMDIQGAAERKRIKFTLFR